MAEAVTVWPSAGTDPRSMGWVRAKVDVGNFEVSMIRPWNWLSRLPESLFTVVMSTVKSPFSTVEPAMLSEPVTAFVRPTPSVDWPNSTSFTR